VERILFIDDHASFRQRLTLDGESGFEVMAQKGVLATEDPSFTVCAGPGFWVVI
jgi:hypothetical protein